VSVRGRFHEPRWHIRGSLLQALATGWGWKVGVGQVAGALNQGGRQNPCTESLAVPGPNKGVQATAASVRSCLAPAARRA